MKSFFQKAAQTLMILPVFALVVSAVTLAPVSAGPTTPSASTCSSATIDVSKDGVGKGAECVKPTTANSPLFGPGGIFVTVTNLLIFIVGAVAVIMLIIGGIRYTVSQGDQNAITSAKNTILYAIIGIVVAVLSFGAVQFVTSQIK